jgi:DeoR/GlpR family transcriptional regulator of sugar metabolism
MKRHKPAQTGVLVKEERLAWILDRLSREGRVLATYLTLQLHVSEDTIRRDLRELASMRRIQRVHGGALPPSPVALKYSVRARQSVPEKKSIARAAAILVTNGMTVFLDGGTTNVHVAESLSPHLRATVITNSVPVAAVLSEHDSVEVVLIGGRLLRSSRVTLGPEAVDAIRSYRADLFLLGTCSVDIEAGITVPHLEEAPVKRAMIAQANRVVGLVTSEKLGTAMPFVVGPVGELDAIVTEASTPAARLEPYIGAGIEIIRGPRISTREKT